MALTTTHTASWGIANADSGTIAGVDGIVTGVDLTFEQIAADEQNELGRIIGHVVYDTRVTGRVSLTVNVSAIAEVKSMISTQGGTSSITIKTGQLAGMSFNVSSAEIVESNTDFMKVNMTVETWASGMVAVAVNALV